MDEQIRQALQDYERRENITASVHAKLLGVSKMTMSDFLRGNKRMGVPLARAIKAQHPDLLHLLLRWLDEPSHRVATLSGGDLAAGRSHGKEAGNAGRKEDAKTAAALS